MPTTITGPKVLAMFGLGFGTVIAVNVALAVNAVRTFPGLEVASSYVASQSFDAERARQERLGWSAGAEIAPDGTLRVTLTDAQGDPVQGAALDLTLGRPTTDAEDRALPLTRDGTGWRAGPLPGPGVWMLQLEATAADGTPWRHRVTLHNGAPS